MIDFRFRVSNEKNKTIVTRNWVYDNVESVTKEKIDELIHSLNEDINHQYIKNYIAYNLMLTFNYNGNVIMNLIPIHDRPKNELYNLNFRPFFDKLKKEFRFVNHSNKKKSK